MHGDWYLLPVAEQMNYKFLMQHTQVAKALTIGGIAPLNMISCVSVKNRNFFYHAGRTDTFFDTFEIIFGENAQETAKNAPYVEICV